MVDKITMVLLGSFLLLASTPSITKEEEGKQQEIIAANITPERAAALDTIAKAEGTIGQPNNGYYTNFGGGQIPNVTEHPRQCVEFNNGGKSDCSTAFGRYQIIAARQPTTEPSEYKTWEKLGTTYFNNTYKHTMEPQNQDLMAIRLLEVESESNALIYIDKGDPGWIIRSCKVWASLPCFPGDVRGAYNQVSSNPDKSYPALANYYKQRIEHYKKNR